MCNKDHYVIGYLTTATTDGAIGDFTSAISDGAITSWAVVVVSCGEGGKISAPSASWENSLPSRG